MMYNPIDMNRIDKQIEDLQRLRANYQGMMMNPPPINNIINQQTQKPLFEAKFTNDNPSDIFVQNKTAFIDLKNNKLTIKEVDGDMKEYGILPPQDEKDIKIQQLEKEIMALKDNYINLQMSTANNQQINSQQINQNSQQINQSEIPIENIIEQPVTETSLEPMPYNLSPEEYTVTSQPTLSEKISSKLKFKK